MKLNSLIKMIDSVTRVIIWQEGDDYGPVFDGYADDLPHRMWKENLDIYKGLENNSCGISVRDSDGETNGAILVISVK